jgi:hypothetical protein
MTAISMNARSTGLAYSYLRSSCIN